ncbi:MAG: (d)CMP kinase, partial [Bacteroidetes bacterium]|nr:(d)CMP kinase [Bacteroidota bacterium]
MNRINIAIDGYSSCGKSTLAKALASELGYRYVDSGSMYRAVTLYCLQNNIINEHGNLNKESLIKNLDKIHLTFHYNMKRKASDIFLNNDNVEDRIRMMDVSEQVSKVSQLRE